MWLKDVAIRKWHLGSNNRELKVQYNIVIVATWIRSRLSSGLRGNEGFVLLHLRPYAQTVSSFKVLSSHEAAAYLKQPPSYTPGWSWTIGVNRLFITVPTSSCEVKPHFLYSLWFGSVSLDKLSVFVPPWKCALLNCECAWWIRVAP